MTIDSTSTTDESDSSPPSARVIDDEELIIPGEITVDEDYAQSLDELSPDDLLRASEIIQSYATTKWADGWDDETIDILDNLSVALRATARRRLESYSILSPSDVDIYDQEYADPEIITYSGEVAGRMVHVTYAWDSGEVESGETVEKTPSEPPEDISLSEDQQTVTASSRMFDGQVVTGTYRFATILDAEEDEILVEVRE